MAKITYQLMRIIHALTYPLKVKFLLPREWSGRRSILTNKQCTLPLSLKTLLTVLCATLYYRHRDLMLAACTGFGDFFTERSNLLVIFANSSFKGVFCKL